MKTLFLAVVGFLCLAAVFVLSGPFLRSMTTPEQAVPVQKLEQVHDPARHFGLLAGHLETMATQWRRQLGIEVVVAIVDAPEDSLAAEAERWIETQKIGGEAPTGGLLVLLEPVGKKARIAVTYGLEGVLPDALLGELADYQLAPYAAYGKPAMAVQDVLMHLRAVLLHEVARGKLELADNHRQLPEIQQELEFLAGGAGAETEIPLTSSVPGKERLTAEQRARYEPSAEPLQSAEAFLRVLEDRVGDPDLPLFTPGTRFQRIYNPVAPYETGRRASALRRSMPFHVIEDGDRAVVLSSKPARFANPILLHRIDGLWRVDTVELFKNVSVQKNGRPAIHNPNNPYAFGLWALPKSPPLNYKQAVDDILAPVPTDGPVIDVAERLRARVAASPSADDHFALAEILFRNGFCWEMALGHYAAALELAPDDPKFLSTAADRVLYLHLYNEATPWLEKLGPAGTERLAWAHRMAGRTEKSVQVYRRLLSEDPESRSARWALAELELLL